MGKICHNGWFGRYERNMKLNFHGYPENTYFANLLCSTYKIYGRPQNPIYRR